MISQWSVLNAPIITVCHKFYISQHWLQLLHTVRWTFEFPKECCAMNNPRNPLRTQLLGKAHTLLPMQWTGPQAAHSEPWVTALHPGKQQAQHHESLLPAAHPIPAPRPTRLACATRLGGWALAWITEVNCLKIMLIINSCINTAEGWWTAGRRWDLVGGKHVFG